MGLKYVELKIAGKTIAVCPVKECEPKHFIELEKQAKANLDALIFDYNATKKENKRLANEIAILKGEEPFKEEE